MKKEKLNYKCEICKAVYGSNPGIYAHVKKAHGKPGHIDKNITMTSNAPTVRKGYHSSNGTAVTKKRKYNRKLTATASTTKFIHLPVVLRIPVTFGEIEITQAE